MLQCWRRGFIMLWIAIGMHCVTVVLPAGEVESAGHAVQSQVVAPEGR
jgi:hypothetical protein